MYGASNFGGVSVSEVNPIQSSGLLNLFYSGEIFGGNYINDLDVLWRLCCLCLASQLHSLFCIRIHSTHNVENHIE